MTDPLPDDTAVPLTILTGFLGAGKTTLLNRILNGDHGLRVAVLVNDFGAVNIDSDLVVDVADDVVSLANGCICCSLRDDLVETVLETINRPERPEYILLEASGVADPGGITLAFHTPRMRDRIKLDSVTCVLDPTQVVDYLDRPDILALQLQQIAFSDMVILNKADITSGDVLLQTRNLIDHHFNNIRIVEATYCDVPYEILLGVGTFDPGASLKGEALAGIHMSAPQFDTWLFESEQPLSLPTLEHVAKRLPGGVFRCKGIVLSEDDPSRPAVLQVVSRRVEITRLPSWNGLAPRTRIVVIGSPGSVDAADLHRRFDQCEVVALS